MSELVCKQCGYTNPEGSTRCEICDEPLEAAGAPVANEAQTVTHAVQTQEQVPSVNNEVALRQHKFEYFVLCPESQTKTVIPDRDATSFYCEGCKTEHIIDGMIWQIEERKQNDNVVTPEPQAKTSDGKLRLEEVNSHYIIEVDRLGGTLGRYGKYGSDFFQSHGMNTVSGEHCTIAYEFGNWVIRHVSKTNQTKYDNKILESYEPTVLVDGKLLTLANTVSFIVRII